MRLFGLIGYPLAHSFSREYFEGKFHAEGIRDAQYRLFELRDLKGLDRLIRQETELCGLNVTIPHKQQVIPMLHAVHPLAEAIGAVNCIRIDREGSEYRTQGYNTDVLGFERSLRPMIGGEHPKSLVLGTGGSARAVAHALRSMDIPCQFVSRNPKQRLVLAYTDLDENLIRSHRLIVNATPVGMYPQVDECPDIPYHFLGSGHLLFDLVYNPPETRFMAMGRKAGASVMNGLEMLHVQADLSWAIWNE